MPRYYIDQRARPGGNGRSWKSAFNSIAALHGRSGEFWLAGGDYEITRDLVTRGAVQLWGGMAGDERTVQETHGGPTNLHATGGRLVHRNHGMFGLSNVGFQDAANVALVILPGRGNVILSWPRFVGNKGDWVGAGAVITGRPIVRVWNITSAGNRAGAAGAGLAIQKCAVDIKRGIVTDNSTPRAAVITDPDTGARGEFPTCGAGVYLYYCSGSVEGINFLRNSGSNGLQIDYGAPGKRIDVKSCVFRENTGWLGAAFGSWGQDVRFEDCAFEGNVSERGGAVCIDAAKGHPTYDPSTTPEFIRCPFINNRATDQYGGAIVGVGLDRVDLVDCPFSGNAAKFGPDVYLSECNPEVHITRCPGLDVSKIVGGRPRLAA